MSEYKFSNFSKKIWFFNSFLWFSRRKLWIRNVTPSFSESLRFKILKKNGVTRFGESTPLRPGGRRTSNQWMKSSGPYINIISMYIICYHASCYSISLKGQKHMHTYAFRPCHLNIEAWVQALMRNYRRNKCSLYSRFHSERNKNSHCPYTL